jgi:hypothetical protein
VDNRQDIREFLSSRRARITPEQADMPIYGGNVQGIGRTCARGPSPVVRPAWETLSKSTDFTG